ncbi:MAG TPA: metallophosphoesterase [Anaerolineaceae bacterium]
MTGLIMFVSLLSGAGQLVFAAGPGNHLFLPLIADSGGSTSVGATPVPTHAPTATPAPTATRAPTAIPTISANDPVVVAAGDIATCNAPGDTQTAALIANNPGASVLALGDNAYADGTALEYSTCYDPIWGSFKNRTYPIPGNHDYMTIGASGYFGYFGAAAANPSQGWYSFNLGSWHILAINSNCVQVGGCNTNSPQEQWVRADLAAHPALCTMAIWHHPRYSSGRNGDFTQMTAIWQDLYNAGADVVLSGHDHDYERFAPQDASGNLDPNRGIVQIVAGTGGGSYTALIYPLQPNSLASLDYTYGILKMTLHSNSYSWQFVPVSGSYTDSGTASCHK